MAQVLYRKYRPSSWDEVRGQTHIVQALKQSAESGSFAHAYLFAGPRGTGKTSLARIFATAIGVAAEDLYEMDAASNRGIDDVRELREGAQVLPLRSTHKLYLIDEVHMLTKDAFNALLKTLEEPPSHVVFILATTELHRVPQTIVSRCQTFTFRKPSQETLTELLARVARTEKIKVNKEALALIATLAEGSFRDALGILQLVGQGVSEVTREQVELHTGAPKYALVLGVARTLVEGRAEEALAMVAEARKNEVDMKVFYRLIMAVLRQAMLIALAPDLRAALKEELASDEFEALAALGSGVQAKRLPLVLKELLAAYELTAHSPEPALPLELAIVRLAEDKE